MNQVRMGVIGMGNIGRQHADYLLKGQVPRCTLTAICSSKAQTKESYSSTPAFRQPRELYSSGLVDAVIVASPHYQHTEEGILAFESGLHVLMEKPISAHKADAERLIATSKRHPNLKFGAMFQMRAEPRFQKIRDLVRSGELGEIVRLNWIITDWYRTDAYYQSSSWRATWKGEGGGVLLNQCLHNLDMISWLVGQPARVRGFCRLGHYHKIEVEDDATAYLEFSNGASAVLVTTTGEAPGTNRLEITGTNGRIVLEQERLLMEQNEVSATDYSRNAKGGFDKPRTKVKEIRTKDTPQPHAAITENFVTAVVDESPLLAPGIEGLNSVELANAILYSSLIGQTVELPMDSTAYENKLRELIEHSEISENKSH